MAIPIIAFTAALAPLLVALACLVAWRKLDGGRHLLFWALGHACLAPPFAIAGFLDWRDAHPVFMVAAATGTTAIVFITAGMRSLTGRQDSMPAVLLAALSISGFTLLLQQAGNAIYYPAAPVVSAALLLYSAILLLRPRRTVFYTAAGIILLLRSGLSLFYATQLMAQSAALNESFALSVLINLTTGLCLIMIEFDNARQREFDARRTEHETTQFLEALLDAMPATMSYKDTDLRYRMMNRRMHDLRQAYDQNYMGRSWSEIVGPDAAAVIENVDRQILATGETAHMEQAWTGPDGRPIVIWAQKVPLRDAEGRIMGIITCGIDITRLKETEAQLIEQREAAESASRTKTTFLSNMSHELRTPLNAIIGFAEMMKDGYAGALGERAQGYAANIHDSGAHLLRLVNDLLDLSRLESGRLDMNIESCSLDQIANSALAMVQPQARQAGVTLQFRPTGLTLPADARALTQILINLLGNAVKFSRPGDSVTLETEDSNGVIRICVIDTGIGMSEAESRAVVQPLHLHRADVYRTRANSGAGLGLSICRSLVELHGGRLDIRSQPGQGTTVEIQLPA
jgi:PAS domain S-box-containing protein